MIDMEQLADFIKINAPAHFRGICSSLKSLTDELECTKNDLAKMLISAQSQENFSKAHEILDAQEALTQTISEISIFINELGIDQTIQTFESEDAVSKEETEKNVDTYENRVDYSQYAMDDTIAYNITDTPVTFKRLSAFSLNGQRYPVTKWKQMLVVLCGLLYKKDASIIQGMVNEKRSPGKRRVRMSERQTDLHSPMLIPGSNIWIETNRSAADLCKWVLILLDRYSISPDSMKVYFRRDYAALHANEPAENGEKM